MKIRQGFVSNSSSSSFVIFKDALSKVQINNILNLENHIEEILSEDESLSEKFEYYDSDPWRIEEHDDYIFGETSMDNFSIGDYLDHINVNDKYVKWDEGYTDEPYQTQLDFIKKMKKQFRKDKIIKINNSKNK